MSKVLTSWVGHADLKAYHTHQSGESPVRSVLGPIAATLSDFKTTRGIEFDEVHLLHDKPTHEIEPFRDWLGNYTRAAIDLRIEELPSPMDLPAIYHGAKQCLMALKERHGEQLELVCHLSSGTSFMAASWLLLVKTRFPAELVINSLQGGLETVHAPFEVHAELLSDVLAQAGGQIQAVSAETEAAPSQFSAIVHQCQAMKRLVQRSAKAALYDLPVLIEGESGTGKELFAKAIHQSSNRSQGQFVAVNCGALPSELVESTLFGHVKGAFTDAKNARKGAFVEAENGTLFLDEIGELPPPAQVKILRALEAREVTPVGATQSISVNARLIAATHCDLKKMIVEQKFREDLFHRLAVAVIDVPPLRQRPGDIGPVLDAVLERVNKEMCQAGVTQPKTLAVGARKMAASYEWPGNVREVYNTLRRAVLWSEGSSISADDFQDALLPIGRSQPDPILGRDLSDGMDLKALIDDVKRHYLRRAMNQTHNNKTQAAVLLGLKSQQTLTNWLKQLNHDEF